MSHRPSREDVLAAMIAIALAVVAILASLSLSGCASKSPGVQFRDAGSTAPEEVCTHGPCIRECVPEEGRARRSDRSRVCGARGDAS